jgi:hypothetical protein
MPHPCTCRRNLGPVEAVNYVLIEKLGSVATSVLPLLKVPSSDEP